MVILFLREKAKKACNWETVARQREREERESSVLNVAESMSRKSQRNSIRNHSLQTHKEFYSDDRDLRRHLERGAHQAILGENSVQRKSYSTGYNMETQNFGTKKFRIHIFRIATGAWNSKTTIIGSHSVGRSSSAREYICVANWQMKNRLHQQCYARNCQKFEEFKKTLLSRRKYWKTTKIGIFSYATWSGNHVQRVYWEIKYEDYKNYWSLLKIRKSCLILTYRAVVTVPSFLTKLHERIWVFLDEILMNYTMIQEIWRFWEQKKLRKVRAKKTLQSIPIFCFSERAKTNV